VLLLGSVLLSGFSALGQTESAKVLVLVDPQPSRPGDTVEVTVYAFDRGVPVDPTSVSVRTEQFPSTTISLLRVATGVYSGSLEITDAPQISVRATVEIGGQSITGRASISIEHPISVRIRPSTVLARPGQLVNISVETSSYGQPQDPDTIQLEALVRESLGPARQPVPLPLGRIDVGRYAVDYEVPQGIRRDAIVDFSILAQLGNYGIGTGASVRVDFPEPLEIWYHTVQVNTTAAIFEVYVANRTGSPVVAADVSVAYAGFPALQGSQTGLTDIEGAVRFEVPLNASTRVVLTGTVAAATDVQGFQGSISVPAEANGPLEIRRENPFDLMVLGETAVLRYSVRDNGTPLAGMPVYYYAYTRSEMITYGSSLTSASGEIEVRFVPPFAVITVDIAAEVAGSWVTASDGPDVPVAHRMTAVIGPAIIGDSLRISGTFPTGAGPWTLSARITGHNPAAGLTRPSVAWTPLYPLGVGKTASGEPGTLFEISLPLPQFLATAGSLTVELSVSSQVAGEYYAFSQVVVLEHRGGSPFPLAFAILLVAIVLSFLAIYVLRRPRRAVPSPPKYARVETGVRPDEQRSQPPSGREE